MDKIAFSIYVALIIVVGFSGVIYAYAKGYESAKYECALRDKTSK
jgi:hypothetical protein